MTAVALATFADEGAFLRARLRAIAADRRLLGEWTPYPTASLGAGPGPARIRLAAVLTGLAGAAALFALTVWSAVWAYDFNSGGRPSFSWPAFIPAPVEFGALASALGGLVLFFRNAGLTRLHHAAFEWEEVGRANLDSFVLAIGCDAGEDANAALAMLAGAGATHSRLVQ